MSAVLVSPAMGAVMGPVAPPVSPSDPASCVVLAAHKLALSRSHLHQAVQMASPHQTSDKRLDAAAPAPGLATVAMHQWWAHHPLRLATDVTADAAKALVQPLAQRHPVALVAGAAAVGALLVWSQPWRWLLTPALLAGLLPKVISHVVNSRPPKA